ncbi:hypothetical protein STFE110948_05880 [Streptobacillus felis]
MDGNRIISEYNFEIKLRTDREITKIRIIKRKLIEK